MLTINKSDKRIKLKSYLLTNCPKRSFS